MPVGFRVELFVLLVGVGDDASVAVEDGEPISVVP